jgi:hypothetical protein
MPISTLELLSAVAALGPYWPARFGHREIIEVSMAVNREKIAGNLRDAITVTSQGKQLLRRGRRQPSD